MSESFVSRGGEASLTPGVNRRSNSRFLIRRRVNCCFDYRSIGHWSVGNGTELCTFPTSIVFNGIDGGKARGAAWCCVQFASTSRLARRKTIQNKMPGSVVDSKKLLGCWMWIYVVKKAACVSPATLY